MKFVTAKDSSGSFVGLIDESSTKVLPLGTAIEKMEGKSDLPASLKECIALGDAFIEKVHQLTDWVSSSSEREELYIPLDSVTLQAPIPRPDKNIFCVGKNYAEHAIEMGSEADIPEHIMVFTKAPTTVIGPDETVLNHQDVTSQLDYEGELAVIIGKTGRAIPREEALDYIFGYTIINDVSGRDLQSRHKQFFIGKSLDTTCPMGPWVVHSSAVENPNKLDIQTTVNGEVRQSSNTENFIFPIEEIITVLSKGMTLEPGDIIATGTPAGVGKGFKPPRFLQPGDTVEITVEKIGSLTNSIEK
ncbi:fumarylacetoacetate hydrolase family protein [Bacillus sp. ISL-47]|uniref:fumarylacetoacetate hydrolase family protein n=1 Tax=Bacillus sp. ISL-47 TaxID=2819130 RepID=UPI001BEAF215|nr:fumarylacetoacetate hydrolase family protein [Bacillus sp. ISL-47]MBT2688988.1 fumarylacetoacetate hydrolase family protein [Bacillus sp. ISL-47]MBT2708733.1 fumarylacetoacetate hydrolase family protein [Pseudomonas sp. ISL-84]